MSLKVSGLTKVFGRQKALDQVSFEAKEGEIVGLLGPNGAGKSTIMKIIACYLPPTAGTVEVYGNDISVNPLKIKKTIGYLPEHNPLYLDMYVHEYLYFVGSMYGLERKKLAKIVPEAVELCGLSLEQNKKLETLSKGYRQRVGLAQALLHDPKTLILDEPTTGLDPNQIVEIRKLIKTISREKTVIFSSHIMQEVQALCDRVIILNRGKIVANDTVSALQKTTLGQNIVLLEFSAPIDAKTLEKIEGIISVTATSPGNYSLLVKPGKDVRPDVFRLAAELNLPLLGLKQEENTMESVFQQLTQANK